MRRRDNYINFDHKFFFLKIRRDNKTARNRALSTHQSIFHLLRARIVLMNLNKKTSPNKAHIELEEFYLA